MAKVEFRNCLKRVFGEVARYPTEHDEKTRRSTKGCRSGQHARLPKVTIPRIGPLFVTDAVGITVNKPLGLEKYILKTGHPADG